MSKTIVYTRVSTNSKDMKNQKLETLQYADRNQFQVTDLLETKISSKKSTKERLVDQLLITLCHMVMNESNGKVNTARKV